MGSRTSPRAGSRSPAWPSCQMSANQAVATKRGRLRMPPERRGGGGPACERVGCYTGRAQCS